MRKILTSILIILSGLAFTQHKPLDAETINKVKTGVTTSATNTITITSSFIQEKEMSILNEKIISTGQFSFKKKKQLRWEYTHPFSYIITIKGDVISVNDGEKVYKFNSHTNKVFEEINRIIIGSVRGTLLEDDRFQTRYSQNNGNYIVYLSPLSEKLSESLREIVIWFNKTDFTVDRLEMIEPGGDRTKITFSDKKINQPLPDEIFILD